MDKKEWVNSSDLGRVIKKRHVANKVRIIVLDQLLSTFREGAYSNGCSYQSKFKDLIGMS